MTAGVLFSQKHLRCLGSRLVASAAEERDKASVVVDGRWAWTGLCGWNREGRDTGGAQAWTELWMEGKGHETGGAWVWTGLGRKGGRDGRCMGVDGAEGKGRETGGARVWTGARREVHGCGRGWGGKREGQTGGGWTELWNEEGGTGGAWVWTGLWREGAKWNEAWRGPMLLHASRQNVVV